MILADKIIELRKKNQWSQEELAAKLGVSRQAVSKWESAQSTPDLERILKMSELFGVSTDTLIKDEIDLSAPEAAGDMAEESSLRTLSLEEANAYLELKEKGAKPIALGVMLCILALLPPILADTFANKALAEPLSAIFTFLIVLCAVALFLRNNLPLKAYAWMDEEPFETAYGVSGMVRERQKALESKRMTHVVVGVCLCILTLICFIASDLAKTALDLPEEYLIALGFAITAIAVYLFVTVSIPANAYKRLLQEEDFSPKKKSVQGKIAPIMQVYWLAVTALYFIYSFITADWGRSWIVWPVAGILSGLLTIVLELVYEKKNQDK